MSERIRRLTINIRDERISDQEAVEFVASVIAKGRISGGGKSYCYGTVRMADDPRGQLSCSAEVTRAGNDSFHLWLRGGA